MKGPALEGNLFSLEYGKDSARCWRFRDCVKGITEFSRSRETSNDRQPRKRHIEGLAAAGD